MENDTIQNKYPFGYHKEYNPQQFRHTNQAEPEGVDAIDIALGDFNIWLIKQTV